MSKKAVGFSLVSLLILVLVLFVLFKLLLWTATFVAIAILLIAAFGWLIRWQVRRGG